MLCVVFVLALALRERSVYIVNKVCSSIQATEHDDRCEAHQRHKCRVTSKSKCHQAIPVSMDGRKCGEGRRKQLWWCATKYVHGYRAHCMATGEAIRPL